MGTIMVSMEQENWREGQNKFCAEKTGRSEGVRAVRNVLIETAYLPPRAIVMFRSVPIPRTLSMSTALPLSQSVLMSWLLLPLKALRIALHRVGPAPH